jgi:hypothetical protein
MCISPIPYVQCLLDDLPKKTSLWYAKNVDRLNRSEFYYDTLGLNSDLLY